MHFTLFLYAFELSFSHVDSHAYFLVSYCISLIYLLFLFSLFCTCGSTSRIAYACKLSLSKLRYEGLTVLLWQLLLMLNTVALVH